MHICLFSIFLTFIAQKRHAVNMKKWLPLCALPFVAKLKNKMARFLSRKEENELVRSNKKVKESHGGHEDLATVGLGNFNLSTLVKLSFKDKLVGEISSAYT